MIPDDSGNSGTPDEGLHHQYQQCRGSGVTPPESHRDHCKGGHPEQVAPIIMGGIWLSLLYY